MKKNLATLEERRSEGKKANYIFWDGILFVLELMKFQGGQCLGNKIKPNTKLLFWSPFAIVTQPPKKTFSGV
jgi:hypothetical protein